MAIDWTKPSREADEWIARNVIAMALGQCPCDPQLDIEEAGSGTWMCGRCGATGIIDRRHFRTDISHAVKIPYFTTDIAAAWRAESHIADPSHELHWVYALAISAILLEEPTMPETDEQQTWAVGHLSPLLRCKAMYRAVCAHRKRKASREPGHAPMG